MYFILFIEFIVRITLWAHINTVQKSGLDKVSFDQEKVCR